MKLQYKSDKWIDFFEQFFENRCKAQEFADDLECITDPSVPKHRAKIIMHQTQRIISLADDIPQIRKGKESLQLMFLLICAENIAKTYFDFKGDGKSKYFVRKFFKEFVVEEDKNILLNGFANISRSPFELCSVVDVLYSVRCDVVHEGKYWEFHFRVETDTTHMINLDPDVVVSITLNQLRNIIARACIYAIQKSINQIPSSGDESGD